MAPSVFPTFIVNNRAVQEDIVHIDQSRENASHIDGESCMSTVREEVI